MRGVVVAALVTLDQRQVQLGRVPFEDHEPDGIAVGEGHRHPQDVAVEVKGRAMSLTGIAAAMRPKAIAGVLSAIFAPEQY
jgi:hypothetical protein